MSFTGYTQVRSEKEWREKHFARSLYQWQMGMLVMVADIPVQSE